jgi:hypothetical protein
MVLVTGWLSLLYEKSSLGLTCVGCAVGHQLFFVLFSDPVSCWRYIALNGGLAGELERVWKESVVF